MGMGPSVVFIGPFVIFGAVTFLRGLFYWIRFLIPSVDQDSYPALTLTVGLSTFLLIVFIIFLQKIKTIKKQNLIRLSVLFLVIYLLTMIGCAKLAYGP